MLDGILLVVVGCAFVSISPCFTHVFFEGFNTFMQQPTWENWRIGASGSIINYQDLILQSASEAEHG